MHDGVRFQVLGPVTVCVGPTVVRLRPKEIHLLAVLLVAPGRTVATETLCDEIWGGGSASTKMLNSLRVHLSHLRSALRQDDNSPSRVVTTERGYSVVINPGELDAANLGGSLVRVRTLAESEPRLALDCAREALALWTGLPFGGLDSPIINAGRRELELLHRDLLLEFARLESAWSERPDRARLRQIQEAEPTSEALVCAVALAEYRGGDQARALEILQEFVEGLDRDLGLVPTSDLRGLQERILREELQPTVRSSGARSSGLETPPDRAEAMTIVRDTLALEGGRVLVSGGPGLGKSVLLQAIAAENVAVLSVDGRRPGDGLAAARAYLQEPQVGAPGAGSHPWQAGSPLSGSVDPLTVLATEVAKRAESDGWPLLVVDDADFLDPDSAMLISRLLDHAGPVARVLASATRSDEALRVLGLSGRGAPAVTPMPLRPLSVAGCAEVLSRSGFSVTRPDLDQTAAMIFERTGGHPYLVAATVRHLVRTGDAGAVAVSAVEFAGRLRAGLPDSQRRVLDLAVLDGPEFDLLAIATAAEMTVGAAVSALEDLLLAGLVVDVGKVKIAAGFGGPLAAAIGPARLTLHLGLAAALQKRGPTLAERALTHLVRAGELADPGNVARTAAAAGQVASQNGHLARSVELYGLAIETGRSVALDSEIEEWSLERVEVRYRAGQLSIGAAEAAEAASRAEMAGDVETFARAAVLAATPGVPELRERSRASQLLVRAASHSRSLSRSRLVEAWEALTRTLVLDGSDWAAAQVPRIVSALQATLAEPDNPADTGLAYLGLRQAGVIEGLPAGTRLASSAAAVESLRGSRPGLLLTAMQARASDSIEAGSEAAADHLADYVDAALWMDDPFHHWLANRLSATHDERRGRDGSAQKHLAVAQEVEDLIDPSVVGMADLVQSFGRLWARRDWDRAYVATRSLGETDEVYQPLLQLLAEVVAIEYGDDPDVSLIRQALRSLRPLSIHLPGYAFAALCAARLTEPARSEVSATCRPILAPHVGSHVVLEGGLADLGPLGDLLTVTGVIQDYPGTGPDRTQMRSRS